MHKTLPWLLLIVPLALTAGGPLDPSLERMKLLEQHRQQLHAKWEAQFRAADTDGNRALTRAEALQAQLPPALLDHFDDIDKDRDGSLTPEELWAVYDRRLAAQRSGSAAAVPKSPQE